MRQRTGRQEWDYICDAYYTYYAEVRTHSGAAVMRGPEYTEAKDRRREVKAALERLLNERVMVGVTPNPAGDGWAVKANIEHAPPDGVDIPDSINDVPVVVQVVGPVKAL